MLESQTIIIFDYTLLMKKDPKPTTLNIHSL